MTIALNNPLPLVDKPYTKIRSYYDDRPDLVTERVFDGVDSKVVKPRTVISTGNTPGYHTLLAKGELVPYTGHHVKGESVVNSDSISEGKYRLSGNCATGSKLATESAEGYAIGGLDSVRGLCPEPTEDSYDPLLTKALGEANTGALLILLELAEAHKTVKLVTTAVFNFKRRKQKLLKLLRTKYKSRRTAKQTANIFADMWLEYRYGWRQLYFSSRDVVTSIDVMSKEQHFVVNTGRGYSSKVETGTVSVHINDSWLNIQLLSKSARTELEQRAVVSLQVYKALAALDFNLVGLAWELVPYSFVLDWFVNIGDVFRATWPVPHVKRTAATSWKSTSTVTVATRISSFGCDLRARSDGLYTHVKEEYKRVPFDGEIPIVFNVNPRLGLSQILDLVSLAVGGYNRRDRNSWRNAKHLRI